MSQARTIQAKDVASRLSDDLDDFYTDGLLRATQFQKKQNFTALLAAINSADQQLCAEIQPSGPVVVYVPPRESDVIIANGYQYSYQYEQSLVDQGYNESINYGWFSAQDRFLDVIEVTSRFVEAFERYPLGDARSETLIRKVSYETFASGPASGGREAEAGVCYYSVDDGRLSFSKSFNSGGFVRFKARIMPGTIRIDRIEETAIKNQRYDVYRVKTPFFAYEWLVNAALYELLPRSAGDARAIAERDMEKARVRCLGSRPSDNNVVVPYNSFG